MQRLVKPAQKLWSPILRMLHLPLSMRDSFPRRFKLWTYFLKSQWINVLLTNTCWLQEQKKREIEEMNRVLAELGIETPAAPASEKSRAGPSGTSRRAYCFVRTSLDWGTQIVTSYVLLAGATEKAISVDENAANGTEIAAGKKKKRKDKEKKAVSAQEEATGQSHSSHEPEVEQSATIDPAEVCSPIRRCIPDEIHLFQGSADVCSLQAKKLLARKTATANAKKSSISAAATLAAKEAKERAAKKAKIRDKKNYNQVCIPSPPPSNILSCCAHCDSSFQLQAPTR